MEQYQHRLIKQAFSQEKRAFFLILCIFQLVLIFIQEDIIGFRADFLKILEATDNIGPAYFMLKIMQIGDYLIVPFKIAYSVIMVAFFLWLGAFAFGYKMTFRSLIGISIISYPALFIPQILKILWFGFINRSYSEFALDHFHDFSLVILLSEDANMRVLESVLRALNIGEVFFTILIVEGIRYKLRRRKRIAWRIAGFSYALLFLLWRTFTAIISA